MKLSGYADMLVYGCARMHQEIYGYRACGFVISGSLILPSWLLFSHPMPLGIGYWYHGYVDASLP